MGVEIGRLCVKLAGRDAGSAGLIVELMDKNFVVVDGNTRRKRVNIDHLELLSQRADIKHGASHEEVIKALEGLGVAAEKKAPAKAKKETATAKQENKSAKETAPEKTKAKKAPAKK